MNVARSLRCRLLFLLLAGLAFVPDSAYARYTYEQALAICEKAYGGENAQSLACFNNLCGHYGCN